MNLLVGLCSSYPSCDKSCILTGGHRFIKHESFLLYARADVVGSVVLQKSVAERVITYEGLVDEVEFQAIKDGFRVSPHVTPRVRAYFEANCT